MDSAVEGLEVLQKGKSLGKTNAKGEFNYNTADGKVTFKLGELALGETEPKSIITPTDLTKKEAESTRILQILQSADTDNNPDNGIKIEEKVAKRFKPDDLKDLVQQSKDSDFNQKLQAKLDTNQKVQTKEKAQEHFYKTLQSEQVTHSKEAVDMADKLVGYWKMSCQDSYQEVVEYKKTDKPNTVISADKMITREYKNQDCTGNYKEEKIEKDPYPTTISVISSGYNSHGQQKAQVRFQKDPNNSQKDPASQFVDIVWLDNNRHTATVKGKEESVTFTRQSSLTF